MINIKMIRPMFNRIVTTMEKYAVDEIDGLILDTNKLAGSLKEFQTVVAVGSAVKGIEVGDLVCINPKRYEVKKFNDGSLNDGVLQQNQTLGYKFNIIELDGNPRLMLYDQDIDYVITDYEQVEQNKTDIIIPAKNIITE